MKYIPYGRHCIDENDINAVVDVLRSDWLTTGAKIDEFECFFAGYAGSKHAVAFSSGTAALHAMMHALGIKAEDEVIVPAITFVATANCIVFQGGTPVFADVQSETLFIDPEDVKTKITSRTKAIIAVDYAGQPCDYDELREIADKNNITLIADACHSLGGAYKGKKTGSLAAMSAFSFHPVKNITCGEGGMVTTDDAALAGKMRIFRNHGITTDHRQREKDVSWFYEMVELGFNYRLTDFQCALAMSQLKKLDGWVQQRRKIAEKYNIRFLHADSVLPLHVDENSYHAYHLYVVRLKGLCEGKNRDSVFRELRAKGIGVNVHYIPVYLQPYYRTHFGARNGLCPVAEEAYSEILSLPLFPAMTDSDVDFIADSLLEAIK